MRPIRASWLAVMTLLASGAVASTACTTAYQLGEDDVAYGDPNALADQVPPGPSNEKKSTGGADGPPACGTVVAQATPCAVSFNKVLEGFKAANCGATGGCHGGNPPFAQPPINTDPAAAKTTWNVFHKFTLSNGKAYTNPCSKVLDDSTIYCNVVPTGNATPAPCGSHMPKGVNYDATLLGELKTWVECGAPEPTP